MTPHGTKACIIRHITSDCDGVKENAQQTQMLYVRQLPAVHTASHLYDYVVSREGVEHVAADAGGERKVACRAAADKQQKSSGVTFSWFWLPSEQKQAQLTP
jgi:hypothetical protein